MGLSYSVPLELVVIAKIVDTKDFHTIEKMQIDERYFLIPEAKAVFNYIKQIYNGHGTRGQLPSRDLINRDIPGFHWYESNDDLSVLCTKLREDKVRSEVMKLTEELQYLVDRSPAEAIATLKQRSSDISQLSEASFDMSMSGAYDILKGNYDSIQQAGGVLGIPYPWHPLNECTQGMRGGQFIVIFGRPKSMKTWCSIYMACHAYMHSRKRVLFYSKEMSPIEIAQRMAVTLAGISYGAYLQGRLQPDLKDRLFAILEDLKNMETDTGTVTGQQPTIKIVSNRGTGSGGGVQWLHSKIREEKPDIVFVDGMYLLKDDRTNQRTVDWKAIGHISQDLKATAQEFNVPVIGITQANRSSDKATGQDLTELAFSDSLGQDADAVYRVSKRDILEEGRKATELYVTAPGMREGVFEGMVIGGTPATDFTFKRKLTEGVMEEEETSQPQRRRASWQPSVPRVR